MNNIITNYINIYQKRSDSIKSSILCFLNQNIDIDIVCNEINICFKSVNLESEYIKNFEIGLVPTKDVISEPWFYDPKYYSEKAIEISQSKQKKYIWIENGKWENDYHNSNDKIAGYLSDWSCFEFPKNIKSMLYLIREGHRTLNPNLPILSEKTIIDTNEVYSWDDKYVLTGTSIENIAMITIEQWERIVKNENCY
ncbi:MAG TPA: hypothetical protein VF941_13975 [Clostridia bacterium]